MTEHDVILVNDRDVEVGTIGKMEAHRKGVLHRAFSIFIFNGKGEMLLQRRAMQKYHSGGLWSNACCSHPRPGEETIAAGRRRLQEELGFNVDLEKIFDFIYKVQLEGGLTEHELDHVLVGLYDGPVLFNTDEAEAVKYETMEQIGLQLETAPQDFTAWFRIAFPRVEQWWKQRR